MYQKTTAIEAARVETLLQARLWGRVGDLQVLVRENGLVLQGHTRTYYVKQLALQAAMEVTALRILANDIQVQ